MNNEEPLEIEKKRRGEPIPYTYTIPRANNTTWGARCDEEPWRPRERPGEANAGREEAKNVQECAKIQKRASTERNEKCCMLYVGEATRNSSRKKRKSPIPENPGSNGGM